MPMFYAKMQQLATKPLRVRGFCVPEPLLSPLFPPSWLPGPVIFPSLLPGASTRWVCTVLLHARHLC